MQKIEVLEAAQKETTQQVEKIKAPSSIGRFETAVLSGVEADYKHLEVQSNKLHRTIEEVDNNLLRLKGL